MVLTMAEHTLLRAVFDAVSSNLPEQTVVGYRWTMLILE
jgi:hypothetical protein